MQAAVLLSVFSTKKKMVGQKQYCLPQAFDETKLIAIAKFNSISVICEYLVMYPSAVYSRLLTGGLDKLICDTVSLAFDLS